MLQEKTARTPHTLRLPGGCRTYVHTPGRVLVSFIGYAPCLYPYVRKRRKHSTAQQLRKTSVNETEKFGKKKNPQSSRVIIFCLIGTPCTGKKKQKKLQQSFSLSLVAARPSRDHLATDSVRVKLSLLSATVSPVARLALSPVLTVAVVRQLDNVVVRLGTSLCDFQPGRKNKHRLNIILQSRTTLKYSYVLYKNHKWRPDRAHSCVRVIGRLFRFMSCTAENAIGSKPQAQNLNRIGNSLLRLPAPFFLFGPSGQFLCSRKHGLKKPVSDRRQRSAFLCS